jgi:hypothetical protein
VVDRDDPAPCYGTGEHHDAASSREYRLTRRPRQVRPSMSGSVGLGGRPERRQNGRHGKQRPPVACPRRRPPGTRGRSRCRRWGWSRPGGARSGRGRRSRRFGGADRRSRFTGIGRWLGWRPSRRCRDAVWCRCCRDGLGWRRCRGELGWRRCRGELGCRRCRDELGCRCCRDGLGCRCCWDGLGWRRGRDGQGSCGRRDGNPADRTGRRDPGHRHGDEERGQEERGEEERGEEHPRRRPRPGPGQGP